VYPPGLNITLQLSPLFASYFANSTVLIVAHFRIIERNGGKPPLTYHQFQNVVAGMDPPEPPVPTVTAACIGSAYTPLKDDHDDHYGVPTLEELGEERSIFPNMFQRLKENLSC